MAAKMKKGVSAPGGAGIPFALISFLVLLLIVKQYLFIIKKVHRNRDRHFLILEFRYIYCLRSL